MASARRPALIVLLCVSACQQADAPEPAVQEPAATDRVARELYDAADFSGLRYLEGDWRGSGYEGGPFYESYRFVNDSTIEMTAWADSTMTTSRSQSQYLLRNGVIRTGDGARLVRIDDDGYHFQGPSYGWSFRQVAEDRWTAKVGPSTIYTMDRIGP